MVYSDDVKYSTATGYLLGKGYSHDLKDQDLNKDQTAAIMFRAAEAYITYIEAYYERTINWMTKPTNTGVPCVLVPVLNPITTRPLPLPTWGKKTI